MDVLTYHYDNQRTGQNVHETVLKPSNVNAASFGRLFSIAMDGWVSAAPLYVHNVKIAGERHNVLYVATEHDSVYAFDADEAGPPLWYRSFIDPGGGVRTLVSTDFPTPCLDLPEMGVIGTPVIDRAAGTLYVVAVTMENGKTVHRLHALNIATGGEKLGGPVVIEASVAGTGDGSAGGVLRFDDLREIQRPALLLSGGVVYIGFAGHCDLPPYHGWLLGYDAKTLKQRYVFNTTPDGAAGGIWMSGGGPATDSSGDVYVSTGNGTFDADQDGRNYGDSLLRLHPTDSELGRVDYFTPSNEQYLSDKDLDLGSGGILILPDEGSNHLLLSGGKGGAIYLCDREHLGGFNEASDDVVQRLSGLTGALFGTPAYWNGQVYLAPNFDVPKMFSFSSARLSETPVSKALVNPLEFRTYGASPVISALGNRDAIVWAVSYRRDADAALYAFDANDLANELYDSQQVPTRDGLGLGATFAVPTVVNGKVYVGTRTALNVFGLLP